MAFGFTLPKLPTQALAGNPSGGSGLTFADKLMMFGAIAKGHPEMAMQIPLMAQARQQFRVQQDATDALADYASGKSAASPAQSVVSRVPTLMPGDDAAANPQPPDPLTSMKSALGVASGIGPGGFGSTLPALTNPMRAPQFSIPPTAPALTAPQATPGGAPTVRGATPYLSKLARAGGNIEPWVKMLVAAQPKAQVVNGRVLDENDPSIYGGYYGEAPTKGAEPVYDGNGKQVGWHMADGAIQAISDVAKATAAGTKAGELPYVAPAAEAQASGTERGKAPYTLVTKDVGGVPTTMTLPQALSLAGGGSGPGSAPQASGVGATAARLDPQAFYKGFVLKHEGGLNPSDLNGAPTMYGFNQSANPDINVKTLTPDTAAQRFSQRYFAQSGAADLPAPLAAAHADTYFINPKKAQAILAQSGGDPGKYMDLREQWLNGLVKTQPGAAKYANAWANRNADLRDVIAQLGGAQPQAGAPVQTSATVSPPGFHGVNADDAKKVATYAEDARTAEDVAQKAHQFQQLNTKTFTGPVFNPVRLHVPLLGDVPLNPISGIGSAFQPGSQAMDNLSMQMASGLRVPGQRLTQAEIFQNLKTVPRRGSLPASNDTSAAVIDDRAATKRAYANFMSDWLARTGSLNGADAAWARSAAGQGVGRPSPPVPSMRAQPMQQIKLKSGGTATVVPVG